VRQNFVK